MALASAAPTSSEQAFVLALSPADQILPVAHDLGERPATLGEAHRHLCQRIGGARLQRPLRELEARLARRSVAAAGTVDRAGCGSEVQRVLGERNLHKTVLVACRPVGRASHDRLGSHVQLRRLRPIALFSTQPGQGVDGNSDSEAEAVVLLEYEERPAISLLCLSWLIFGMEQLCQGVEVLPHVRMFGAKKTLLGDGECASYQRLL